MRVGAIYMSQKQNRNSNWIWEKFGKPKKTK